MNRLIVISVLIAVLLGIDYYLYQGILMLSRHASEQLKQFIKFVYWGITALSIGLILAYNFGNPDWFKGSSRSLIFTGLFINYFSKIFALLFFVVDDLIRLAKWLVNSFQQSGNTGASEGTPIPRSEFLLKTAMLAGSVPAIAMVYGIVSGAHDYRIRRHTIYLPELPGAFDGIRVAQISDIHSGSFFNKTAVKGGVEMMMREKADIICFTGDLVNNRSEEVADYIPIFSQLKADLGVFSVTGNHDYGDYASWPSEKAKSQNFEDLKTAHLQMGYQLLMNEHRMIRVDGQQIAILGNENWGAGRFAKYGRLDQAYKGAEEAQVKILLSHDPSHWDAQVRPNYGDIDLMLAGHTHGFQFGVEVGEIKWSPAQYAYKQWAGLYQEGAQNLYVNRGFGYLGYPGRVGMPPEITILTLKTGVQG